MCGNIFLCNNASNNRHFTLASTLDTFTNSWFAVSQSYQHDEVRKKDNANGTGAKGHDIGNFARSFNCRKIDTWVIRAVYEQIQDYVSTEKITLPIYAEDNLFEDLEIGEEDLYEDLSEEIAQRTGRSFDNVENNPYFNKVNTVGDLVNFFNNQPLKSINKSTA